MFCESCLEKIILNKLGMLEIQILKILFANKSKSLSSAKTTSYIEEQLKEIKNDEENFKVTDAYLSKATVTLQLFELIIVDSMSKPQRYYLSESGVRVIEKLEDNT